MAIITEIEDVVENIKDTMFLYSEDNRVPLSHNVLEQTCEGIKWLIEQANELEKWKKAAETRQKLIADWGRILGYKGEDDAIVTKMQNVTFNTPLETDRIKKIQAELDQAKAENVCDVCLGKPLPSGRSCICKGTGKMSVAAVTLREQMVELQIKLDEEYVRIKQLEIVIDNGNMNYGKICSQCGNKYQGHKRSFVCGDCVEKFHKEVVAKNDS